MIHVNTTSERHKPLGQTDLLVSCTHSLHLCHGFKAKENKKFVNKILATLNGGPTIIN